MASLDKAGVSYPEAFAAVGRYVAKRGLVRVCALEFEGGIIVSGSFLYETREGYAERVETHVLASEELKRLIKER